MKIKPWIWRVSFYILGMSVLAMGLTLSIKTGLGVSPIISIPYSISKVWGLNFGNVTFIFYILLILIQITIKKKNTNIFDLLQIVISIVFTRLLNFLSNIVNIHIDNILINLFVLIIAIILIGIGAAMSVNTRLIANPGDGIVQTISDATNKDMGLIKNIVDMVCILISIIIGLSFRGKLVGVGIGTVAAVLGTGRVIWLYNKVLYRACTNVSRRS